MIDQTIARTEAAQLQLRDHFLGWQCRVRQYSSRHEGGRPSIGMRPKVSAAGVDPARIVVLINKREPETVTTEFRHLVLRTADPKEQYKAAVRKFSELYYQGPRDFSDVMTALFGPKSRLVEPLLDTGTCELEFDYQRQRYQIPCRVDLLPEPDPAFQATYWHNRLFNPNIPQHSQILAFTPDWGHATANPSPSLDSNN